MRESVTVKEQLFASDFQLSMFLDYCFRPVSENTYDNLYRVLLWLAFAGMPLREALAVDESEVDVWNMAVAHGGRTYPFSPYALPAIRGLTQMDTFTVYGGAHPRRMKRESGTLLLRRTAGVKSAFSPEERLERWIVDTMRPSVRARFMEAERRFLAEKPPGYPPVLAFRTTYRSIVLSGICFRIYQQELAGIAPDYSGLRDFVMDQDGSRVEANRKVRVYKKDYQVWKAAFAV